MAFTIFITAPTIPVKQVHKALISLEDYEYGCSHSWTVLRTAKQIDDDNDNLKQGSVPPLDLNGAEVLDDSNNAFAGKTSDEIFAFTAANEDALHKNGLTYGNWLIVDERGFREKSCLVCHRDFDAEDEEEELEEEEEEEGEERDRSPFLMARIPWVEAWGMFTNLDLANMDFEEWVDEDKGKDENGEYTWVPFSPGGNIGEKAVKKREMALEKAREEGMIE